MKTIIITLIITLMTTLSLAQEQEGWFIPNLIGTGGDLKDIEMIIKCHEMS